MGRPKISSRFLVRELGVLKCIQSLALCLIYGDQLINAHISVMVGDGYELDL